MFLIIIGGVLLFFGAEGLVRGSASLVLRLGVHPLIAGLTVVAFGTSAPELSVSMSAAFESRGGIAIGNIVGSNIFNIAVILGIAASVSGSIDPTGIGLRDGLVMLGLSCLLLPFSLSGRRISRWEGGVLLSCNLAYLFILWPR